MNASSPQPDDDARFDAWMSQQASSEPLPDAGFSARVLAALPPARRPIAWRQTIVYATGALVGILATRLDLGEWPKIGSIVEPLNHVSSAMLTFFSDPWMAAALASAVMLAAAGAALLFALRDEDSPESFF